MKTTLTIEESARLVELGVDPKLASKTIVTDEYNEEWENFRHPIFTLTDILSILPKEIDGYYLNISAYTTEWHVYYEKIERLGRRIILRVYVASELIDALNQLLIWAITSGYCKCGKGGGR